MTIKPIDLQTNISQMVEVGRNEQAKTGAVAEMQHLLDEESDEKSKLINSKLDEAKKGDSSAIKDEDKKKDRRGKREEKEEEKKKKSKERKLSKDDRMGRIIDVLK